MRMEFLHRDSLEKQTGAGSYHRGSGTGFCSYRDGVWRRWDHQADHDPGDRIVTDPYGLCVYFVLPLSGLMIVFFSFVNILDLIQGQKNGQEEK